MQHRVLLGLTFLALSPGLKAVRWESTHLAPEASGWFEPNQGQVGGRTEWTARVAGAWLFLTSNEVVFVLPPETHFDPKKTRGIPTAKTTNVHMRIVGGRRVNGVGEKALGGYSNYFLGKHENEWFSGVPHFGQIRYPEVYPGIDMVFYTTRRNIEYDFIVKPGGDPSVIDLSFDGAVRLDESGNLVVAIGGKSFLQHRPRVFQGSSEIDASYRITKQGTVKVAVTDFDPLVTLRVDPILDFSTYLGGPGEDYLNKIAISSDGNLILAGNTQSPASPALDPFQQTSIVSEAPIILKMSADGKQVLFYTILGRNGWDSANALAIAKDGSLIAGGSTRSATFPVKSAFQTEFKAIWDNAWVTRLTGDGRSIVYSSYLGGSNREQMNNVTLDDAGNAYFIGNTQSGDFPNVNPLQDRRRGIMDAFLTKISPEGKLLFSTYFGGEGAEGFWDLKWRKDGTLVLTGGTGSADFPLKDPIQSSGTARSGWNSAFLTMIADDGSAVRYSTYIGGTSSADGFRLLLGPDERIYIGGAVLDRGFPLKNPLFADAEGQRGYLAIFDPTGRELQYSTLLPGMYGAREIAIGADGRIYIAGTAYSTDFPAKDSFQPFRGGGVSNADAFLLGISPDGSYLLFATVMGGGNNDSCAAMVLGQDKTIYGGGTTTSGDFPIKNAYQGTPGGSFDGLFYRIKDNSVLPTAVAPFAISPGRLTFRYVLGDSAPMAVPVAITGLNGQVISTLSVPWLRITPSSLGVSGTMRVSVDPAGLAPGVHQGSIRLTPSSGAATSVDVTFTVLAAAPILSVVEPPLVAVGSDDTEITLRGSGFTSQTAVQLQTVPWQLTPVRFINSTTLKFTLPKTYFSAEYNHSITVQNPDSAVSKPVSLAVGRPAPAITDKGIRSAASYAGEVISPGEIITIFGRNFEPGMRVNFDGILAATLYITPDQLNVIVPPSVAGAREANVMVEMNSDWRSVPVRIPLWPARPGLFTADSSGKGLTAALNQDGSVNSAANPAAKGSIVALWGTGGGVDDLPVKVFVDGIDSEVLYAGGKDGLWQVNVRTPEFAVKGEVVWRVGERESQESVTIALRE